jgi:uncharacterized integral membrane protein
MAAISPLLKPVASRRKTSSSRAVSSSRPGGGSTGVRLAANSSISANVSAKNAGHPGTLSQIAWVVFCVGVLLMIVLGVAAFMRSRR